MNAKALSRREAGELRIRAALDHVQEAQIELSYACRDLCAVVGYNDAYQRISKLHDKVKSEWYKLDARLQKQPRGRKGELDRTPEQRDADPHDPGCGQVGWKPSWR